MSDKKIKVPEEMLKAACRAYPNPLFDYVDDEDYGVSTRPVLEAALLWLDSQIEKLVKQRSPTGIDFYRSPSMSEVYTDDGYNIGIAEVRRMFLAPAPEAPKEINDLLQNWQEVVVPGQEEKYRALITEAYRRGTQDLDIKVPEEAKDIYDLEHYSVSSYNGGSHRFFVCDLCGATIGGCNDSYTRGNWKKHLAWHQAYRRGEETK